MLLADRQAPCPIRIISTIHGVAVPSMLSIYFRMRHVVANDPLLKTYYIAEEKRTMLVGNDSGEGRSATSKSKPAHAKHTRQRIAKRPRKRAIRRTAEASPAGTEPGC